MVPRSCSRGERTRGTAPTRARASEAPRDGHATKREGPQEKGHPLGPVTPSPLPTPPPSPTTQVFGDPYKATVTKESGAEVEEDIYEAYNLGLVSFERPQRGRERV